MAKLLILEANPAAVAALQSLRGEGHEISFDSRIISDVDLSEYKGSELLSVFVFSRVSKEVIASLPGLRFIITRSAGYDHIDLEAASERGIVVSNVPGYGNLCVAEHVFALLLALLRKVVAADAAVRAARWPSQELQGKLIYGKTFGLIGTGAIGANAAKLAKAFGATVIAYDVIKRPELEATGVLQYASLDEVLGRSDIISLHVPLLKETHHMINESSISKMKDGAILINTSRGAVVDQNALTLALQSGKLSGAGLDVLEKEPPSPADPLLKLDNVVLSPHTAWNTDYSENYILQLTIKNINAYLSGKPQNVVNLQQLKNLGKISA
jgi:phosphoglycerate dehydrogenase-like enzyme